MQKFRNCLFGVKCSERQIFSLAAFQVAPTGLNVLNALIVQKELFYRKGRKEKRNAVNPYIPSFLNFSIHL